MSPATSRRIRNRVGRGHSFWKVWAMLEKEAEERQKEAAIRQKEAAEREAIRQKEAAEREAKWQREAAIRQKEAEERKRQTEKWQKEYEERQKQLDRQMRATDKQLGKLGNRFGEMVEYMVMPNLIAKFHELGFDFEKAYHNATIKDKTNKIYTEVDITLENGDKIMLVEVKSKPKTEDITEHVERIEKVRFHANLHGEKRKYLGAVAGMVFNENEKQFALKNGFYVIEPSGETFIITVPEGEYSPREW